MKYLLLTIISTISLSLYSSDRIMNSPNYSKELKTFVNIPNPVAQNKPMSFWEMVFTLKEVFFNLSDRIPDSPLPSVKPDIEEFLKPSERMKFIWFGHSSLLLRMNGKNILIDPVFSDYAFALDLMVKRFQAPALGVDELPPIDHILISHNHYDHMDKKTILAFKDKDIQFIVPLGVGAELEAWGIKEELIQEFDWWDEFEKDGIKYIATPSQHFSGRSLFDRNKTLWASWVIKSSKDNIYYSSDSGYAQHFKEIGKKYGPFDLTFMENGQYNPSWADVHMLPEETIEAHIDVKGKILVPVHWGMFTLALHHWSEPVEKTSAIAKEKNIDFFVPQFGEIVDLVNLKEWKAWW